MPPPLLGQRVRPRDRVAGARGRHVVRIRINTRRTRWILKKTGVNANALRGADAPSLSVCFSTPWLFPPPSTPYPRLLHLFFFSFSVQGCCHFCERDSRYLHVQYHPSHSEAHSKEARTRILFFSVPYTTRPTTTMTNPPTRPSGPHVYLLTYPPPIVSLPNRQL